MSANTEILGNHGASHLLSCNGRTYLARCLDRKMKTAFEKHLFKRARDMAAALKEEGDMDEAKYEKHLLGLNDKYLAGDYSIMSKNGMAHLNSASGQLFLASLIFGVEEDEMLNVLVAKPTETSSLIKLVLTESMPDLKYSEADPNALAPA